jgi:hypothetical protein
VPDAVRGKGDVAEFLGGRPVDRRWRDGRIAAPRLEDQPLKVIVMSLLFVLPMLVDLT